MHIKKVLKKSIHEILTNINIPKEYTHHIKISSKSKIGHYQINGIMNVCKILHYDIKILSQKIILSMKNHIIYKKIKYSNPGFINIFLHSQWLSENIEKIIYSHRLGIIKEKKKKNIIIDYSSPNMAKEMHVGHLRSTILGDVMARTLEFLGHHVIRINHIGDWGLQFGMLIAFLNTKYKKYENMNLSLKNLEKIYQKSKKLYEKSKIFQEEVNQCLIKLHQNDNIYINIWKKIIQTTIQANQKIYNLLNVTLKNKHIFGESFYIKLLPKMILDLKNKNIAKKKDGNTIIYLKHIKNKHGQPMGVIIQKKNNIFLYTTIDLACLKYRIEKLHADKIIYYTDIRQKQHFTQILSIAKQAKYIPKNFPLEHHTFGMILNKENKPFKTRNGQLIKLYELIKEAIERSKKIIKSKNPNLKKNKILHLAKIIGISAIKYFDLSKNRKKNYIFDWDNMLSFHGNTALYIQYTYTRIQSIIKKSKFSPQKIYNPVILTTDIEINLSIQLLQFVEIIKKIKKNGTPHILCLYLFKLSSLFSIFYEKYSINHAKKINIQKSRLKLSFLVAKTIKLGLKLLGIYTIKCM